MKKIILRQSHILLNDYDINDCTLLENIMSYYDDKLHSRIPIGYSYDPEKRELRVPRGIDPNYIKQITGREIEIDNETINPSIRMVSRVLVEPRDDLQRKAIAFMTGAPPYEYTKARSQMAINCQPGFGKTYISITALSIFKERAIIITHREKIKNQWIESFDKFSSINKDDICEIKGSKVIDKILNSEKDPKYKVYLVNRRTLMLYGEKNGYDKLDEFFRKIKIGLKIVDEAHLEFRSVLNIDLHTNIKRSIYLTATLQRSDYKENKVMENVFKNVAKFTTEYGKELRKHINYVAAFFDSKPSYTTQASMKNYYGFSKTKYCSYLIENRYFLDTLVVLTDKYTSMEGKILILATLIDACDVISELMYEKYPDKKIGIYHSKISKEEKEKINDMDIIISTPGSFGTGSDLPGLRFAIMTEPYSSEVTADQISGRLRSYDDNAYCLYTEMIDTGFSSTMSLYKKRKKVFKKKCNKFLELDLSN